MLRVTSTLLLAAALAGCSEPKVKECSTTCNQGQRCDTATGLCVQDAPPTVMLRAVTSPVISPKLTVQGTAADDVGVVRGEAFFDGQPPVPLVIDADGFSAQLDVPQLDSATTTVKVRVFDTGDQASEGQVTAVVDRLGPAVTVSAPGELRGGAEVTIAGAAQDGSGTVTRVEADFGLGPVRATLRPEGTWTVRLAPPAGRDAQLTPLLLTATDTFGNARLTEVEVPIDTRGPTFELVAPTATVGGAAAGVAGRVADAAGAPGTVTVGLGSSAQSVTAVDGGFIASVPLPQQIESTNRELGFSAADRFGNTGTAAFMIAVDTRGPSLTLVGPAVIGTSGELSGTASDFSPPISNITLQLEGTGAMAPVDSFTNGTWRAAVSFPPGLNGEQRSVAIRARDALGNEGTAIASVRVDTVPPVGSFSTPAANARLSGAMATISGMVSDATSVQLVEIDFADGQGYRPASVSSGGWAVSVPLSATENDAPHLITARFTDALGNVSSATRAVTVDNVGPMLAVTSPAAGTIIGGAATTVAVTVTASDPAAVASVSVSIGAGVVASATRQGASTTWTAAVAIPAGQDFVTLPLRAVATDGAGNSTTGSINVVVDNVAPVLTITAPTAMQVFNQSHFAASGNVNVAWTVSDGDPQGRVTSVGGSSIASGTSTAWPTVTTDNYTTYNLPVVATDRMGNSTTRAASFVVDRVAPTVVFSPAAGTRNVEPRQIAITFSEELAASPTAPLVLAPASAAPAGTWSGFTYTRANLEPSTAFTASVASGVTDRAGNPVAATSSAFHTSAARPMNGALVASSVWAYDVASDQDGVPLVMAVTQVSATSYSSTTFAMSAATGTFSSWGFASSSQLSITGYQAFAWRSVNADLSATPVRGVWQDSTESCAAPCSAVARTRRAWAVGTSALMEDGSGTLVPTAPLSSADGSGPVGFINGQTYTRSPAVSHPLQVTPARVAPGSVRWNVAGRPTALPPANTSAEIWVSSYLCATYGIFNQFSNCFPVAGQAVSDVATSAWWSRLGATGETLSIATSDNGCTLLSYPSVSMGRRLARIADTNSRAPCGGTCLYFLSTTTLTAPTSDFVVGRGPGTTLLGVGTVAGGAQLYQSSDCGSTWPPVGSPLPSVTDFKPVLIGTKPGFFYLDAARALRVHVP
jgi:hypothetical protein